MRHTILTVLLTLGVVFGTTFGFMSLCHHRHHGRAHFQEHVAKLCVDAASEVLDRGRSRQLTD